MNFDALFRRKPLDGLTKEEEAHGSAKGGTLQRTLTARDLTALGIAAIIGAGIFSTIGQASANGGPAVIILFVFTGLACGFSALCYAEFASMVPTSGSAYTYAYVTFGELVAWIIGWGLILEYCVGNITVAISWSDYFTVMLDGWGIQLPYWATQDYISAHAQYTKLLDLVPKPGPLTLEAIRAQAVSLGHAHESVNQMMLDGYQAWTTAPRIGNFHVILDIPALVVNVLITMLVFIGIRESKNVSNALVLLKLGIIAVVLSVGVTLVRAENWEPFMPNGLPGVMRGVGGVFFAYIGFDAITTTSEESVNPKRDLPIAIFASLIICTILYIAIALVLTGMVPYHDLNVGDPLAFAFQHVGMAEPGRSILVAVIAVSAVVAMTSVLLVFQMGQPRIWMSMSRDGLLPARFSRIHRRFRTPAFATIVTGLAVGIPILFLDLASSTDVTSIGTLFAFVLVCSGILRLALDGKHDFRYRATGWSPASFKLGSTHLSIYPLIWLVGTASLHFTTEGGITALYTGTEAIPILLFFVLTLGIVGLSLKQRLPLIPVLGLTTCAYLMAQVPLESWGYFAIWMTLGLAIYFGYGIRKSKLR